MQRIVCSERNDWVATAESAGFDFHTIDGERYWDERAYYAFTLDEIERADFAVLNQRISLTPIRKLWIAWRTWVAPGT